MAKSLQTQQPMISKISYLIVILLFAANSGIGAETIPLFVETESVNGFSVGLTGEFGFTNTEPSQRLCFSIWSTNVPTKVIFPTGLEYAFQVELFDTNNISIQKTEAGKKMGMHFNDFDANPAAKGIRIQHAVTEEKGKPSELIVAFRPSDLFKIEKPGTYHLKIRFQLVAFPSTGPGRKDYTNELIRFKPLDYILVQP